MQTMQNFAPRLCSGILEDKPQNPTFIKMQQAHLLLPMQLGKVWVTQTISWDSASVAQGLPLRTYPIKSCLCMFTLQRILPLYNVNITTLLFLSLSPEPKTWNSCHHHCCVTPVTQIWWPNRGTGHAQMTNGTSRPRGFGRHFFSVAAPAVTVLRTNRYWRDGLNAQMSPVHQVTHTKIYKQCK